MDILEKWHAYFTHAAPLLRHWEHRRAIGAKISKRDREILTLCFFVLCFQHKEGKRMLIGFPQKGQPRKNVTISDLFENVGDVDDWDAVLCPDLGETGGDCEFHQCQVVGYTGQPAGNTEDLIAFIEKKKMRRSGGDLRLIIHLEQPTSFDWVKFGIYLGTRRPRCPYAQVFVLGRMVRNRLPKWVCMQLFPRVIHFPDLDDDTARALLRAC